ncbi:uncharacterized protein [Solanum tuberosum]|uniref:uncharacterized protein isoform X4 n=1 Tax=Solanum tuberosum TaxID=4113 RepID=UPI00073A4F77|nr:PREDICTED: uncharacterized protein LOC102578875 isoform X4 [Solanum tuberosum]XP_015160740.1 PREDICTED: uncharacterized protein LOC102578875 isoform X4 [Solanum tuberosum]
MESEGDEDTHQPPKWSRPTKQAQFSSTSKKDSFLTIPVLPEELITEILLRLPVEPLLKFSFDFVLAPTVVVTSCVFLQVKLK